jgi:hypothetical protein
MAIIKECSKDQFSLPLVALTSNHLIDSMKATEEMDKEA